MAGTVLVCLALFTGCSATSLSNTWRDPAFSKGPYQSVLVVSALQRPELRRQFEDEFVRQLQARGMKASASYNSLPDVSKLAREPVEKEMAAAGAQAVLVTRLLEVKQQQQVYSATNYDSSFRSNYYWEWDQAYSTPVVYDYNVYSLGTSLYDGSDGKMVWTASTETADPQKISREVADAVTVLTKAMSSAGIIPAAPK
jgi:hypothetical protein